MSVEHHLVVGTHEETVTRFMFPMLLGLSRDPTAGTEVGPLGDISTDRKTLMLQQLTVAGSDSQIMWQCCTMSSPQTTHRGAPRNRSRSSIAVLNADLVDVEDTVRSDQAYPEGMVVRGREKRERGAMMISSSR